MLGLMQSQPLLISSLIEFAARNHADGEIVSRRVEGDIHRYTYKDLAARSRQLANKLDAMGLVPGMPHFSFISLGLVAAGAAYWIANKQRKVKEEEVKEVKRQQELLPSPARAMETKELGWDDVTPIDMIGLEVGLIIGMIAGLASIIPYLGFAVGMIAAVIATLFQFGIDWMQLVLVLVVFMIGQAVEGYILQPFLLGDKIGLSPVAVVFAVLAGAQLAGFLGMLIALPVAAIIVVLLRHARDCYEKSQLYGSPALILQDISAGTISIHTEQADVEVELKERAAKPLQEPEKSGKIEGSDNKDP